MKTKNKPTTSRYRGAAFLDVDGTLVDRLLVSDFALFLTGRGEFNRKIWNELSYILDDFRRRYRDPEQPIQDAIAEYDAFARYFFDRFGVGIKGRGKRELESSGEEFIDRDHQRFHYPFGVIRTIKEHGYTPVIVSGGPSMIINPFAAMVGIEHVFSTEYQTEDDGKYTGNIDKMIASYQGKKETVERFLTGNKIDKVNSAGFGDAVIDLGFLEQTRRNFVVSPSAALRKIAEEKEWEICDDSGILLTVIREKLPKLTK